MKTEPENERLAEAKEAAREAGLRYINDSDVRGIERIRHGKGFAYRGPEGKKVGDEETLGRIRSLAIPPAWREVWICPRENGHIQAVGIDARGRKQYRYHPKWREVRDEDKYHRMLQFAKALPKLRRTVNRHLRLHGLPREKVLAAIVRLLETTLIRVGNDQYARDNRSYGLTTIHNKHVKVRGAKMQFEFRGKSGVDHEIDLEEPRLAKVVKKCQELPGQELFKYLTEEGEEVDVKSDDVNEYLKAAAGEDFTAKDFRTWAGTLLAARALQEFEDFDSEAAAKRNIINAVETVAKRLGNTRAVCRKCYIHPAILEAYTDRSLLKTLKTRAETTLRGGLGRLTSEEGAVLALLQRRLAGEIGADRKKKWKKAGKK